MTQILCIVTAGEGGQDELRARRLMATLAAEVTCFLVDKCAPRQKVSRELWAVLSSRHWDLVYQEGTGIAGGFNLIRAARTRRQRYIVSSGDPIGGFFRVTKSVFAGSLFELYEKRLYRACAGFVGWTPYLTGMALKMGARRAVTVEGAVDLNVFQPLTASERRQEKQRLKLEADHLVCGVVGSLRWSARQSYCYGLELIETLKRVQRPDVSALIVGDGDGRDRLERAVPDSLRSRIVFTGRLSQPDVVRAMNAMDIGFVTQTLDELGSYRLTTKLPEYLACETPVAMSPVPGYFDYAWQAGWPLPARHPAHAEFHAECARWLDARPDEDVLHKRVYARAIARQRFDADALSKRFAVFVEEILSATV